MQRTGKKNEKKQKFIYFLIPFGNSNKENKRKNLLLDLLTVIEKIIPIWLFCVFINLKKKDLLNNFDRYETQSPKSLEESLQNCLRKLKEK